MGGASSSVSLKSIPLMAMDSASIRLRRAVSCLCFSSLGKLAIFCETAVLNSSYSVLRLPNKESIETEKKSAILGRSSVSGTPPFSHLDTACVLTPTNVASCSYLTSRSFLSDAICLPIVSILKTITP